MGFAQRRKGVELALFSAVMFCLIGGCDASPSAPVPEFIDLPGIGNAVMIIPEGLAPDRWKAVAKDHCGSAPMCTISAWTSKEDAARALPMTDAELASEAFSYGTNRSTGFDQALWDCRRFKRANADECLAVP